jgi:hypothetical protein
MMKNIDFSKPLRTKDGLPVTLVTTAGREPYPVVGFIGDYYMPKCWTKTGNYSIVPNEYDLVNVPEKQYVNLYHKENKVVAGIPRTRLEDAITDSAIEVGYIKTVEIEWY